MNHTATSIISTKKELMDKIDFVSKTDSKQGSLDNDDSLRGGGSPIQHKKHDKFKNAPL